MFLGKKSIVIGLAAFLSTTLSAQTEERADSLIVRQMEAQGVCDGDLVSLYGFEYEYVK